MFLPPAVTINSFLRPVIHRIAIVIESAQVAGVQPAVANRRRRVLRPVPIAVHDVRPAGQDFAIVGDANFDAGNRPADRADRGSRRDATMVMTGDDSVSP